MASEDEMDRWSENGNRDSDETFDESDDDSYDSDVSHGSNDSQTSARSEHVNNIVEVKIPIATICPLNRAEQLIFTFFIQHPTMLDFFDPWMREVYLAIYWRGVDWMVSLFR